MASSHHNLLYSWLVKESMVAVSPRSNNRQRTSGCLGSSYHGGGIDWDSQWRGCNGEGKPSKDEGDAHCEPRVVMIKCFKYALGIGKSTRTKL